MEVAHLSRHDAVPIVFTSKLAVPTRRHNFGGELEVIQCHVTKSTVPGYANELQLERRANDIYRTLEPLVTLVAGLFPETCFVGVLVHHHQLKISIIDHVILLAKQKI